MRYDICLIKESSIAGIPSENFMFIPNGLAEKVKDIFDWKQSIVKDKSGEMSSLWMKRIRAQKFPCLWSSAVFIGKSPFEVKYGNAIEIYFISGEYEEKTELFLFKIKDFTGKDGALTLKIVTEESFCAYEGEELLNLYRSYNQLSKQLEKGTLYNA